MPTGKVLGEITHALNLQEAAREERARVRKIRKRINEVREGAIVELVRALEAYDIGAWRWLAGGLAYHLKDKQELTDIFRGVAEHLVGSPSNWTGDSYYRWLLGEFEKYGLPSPEMQVGESE